jgi:hypothetical protein
MLGRVLKTSSGHQTAMDLPSGILELLDDLAADILERDVIHRGGSDAGDLIDDLVMLLHRGHRVRIESARVRPALFLDQKRHQDCLQQAVALRLRR